jgi:hypothetical protein
LASEIPIRYPGSRVDKAVTIEPSPRKSLALKPLNEGPACGEAADGGLVIDLRHHRRVAAIAQLASQVLHGIYLLVSHRNRASRRLRWNSLSGCPARAL